MVSKFKFLALCVVVAGVLLTWSIWPAIVVGVIGFAMPPVLSCDRPDLIAKIGDSYGSLNALTAIAAVTAAGMSLMSQQRQIRDVQRQQTLQSALHLVGVFCTLDSKHSGQRLALLKAIVETSTSLSAEQQVYFRRCVRPTEREREAMKLDAVLGKVDWNA